MKKALTVSLAFAALSAPAFAADVPVKAPVYKAAVATPAYNWSGAYVGGHFGYLWGRTTVWDEGVLTDSNAPTNGIVGGILGGVNWQVGTWVFGIDADFGWSNAKGTGEAEVIEQNFYDIRWTSHVRGRLGYALNNWLWFVASGLALADINFSQNTTPQNGGTTYTGWSIGGGVDYAFNRNWIARLEYLYDDFGHKDYLIDTEPYRVKVTGHTLRGALVFKH